MRRTHPGDRIGAGMVVASVAFISVEDSVREKGEEAVPAGQKRNYGRQPSTRRPGYGRKKKKVGDRKSAELRRHKEARSRADGAARPAGGHVAFMMAPSSAAAVRLARGDPCAPRFFIHHHRAHHAPGRSRCLEGEHFLAHLPICRPAAASPPPPPALPPLVRLRRGPVRCRHAAVLRMSTLIPPKWML